MDSDAKQAQTMVKTLPLIYTAGALWQIYIGDAKIWNNISEEIYDHMHDQQAVQHWKDIGKITNDCMPFLEISP